MNSLKELPELCSEILDRQKNLPTEKKANFFILQEMWFKLPFDILETFFFQTVGLLFFQIYPHWSFKVQFKYSEFSLNKFETM